MIRVDVYWKNTDVFSLNYKGYVGKETDKDDTTN